MAYKKKKNSIWPKSWLKKKIYASGNTVTHGQYILWNVKLFPQILLAL